MSDGRPGLLLLGAGRMGRLLHERATGFGYELLGVTARRQPDWLDSSLWIGHLDDAPTGVALLIDFSLPGGTSEAAAWCAAHGVPLLSGTTGLGPSHREVLERAASAVPVLWSANFSIGVNGCLDLVKRASARLAPVQALHILDIHHVHKQDAPSGTALALGAAATPLEPEYHSVRQGETIGEHRVKFLLEGEELEIIHRAFDRGIYAHGALAAGLWLLRQPAGMYLAADWMDA